MKREEYLRGMKSLEVAVQGEFAPAFSDLVQVTVEKTNGEIWKEAVKRLMRLQKPVSDFKLGDFLEAIDSAARERGMADRWKPRAEPAAKPPDWDRLHANLQDDPVAPEGAKAIARFLVQRKNRNSATEPVRQGGEKYRTKSQ